MIDLDATADLPLVVFHQRNFAMRALALVLSLLLAACATTPAQIARPISPTAFSEMQPGYGSVTVIRDKGFMGSACKVRVFADGAAVGELRPGEQVTVYLAPGDHVFGANATGICGGGTAEVGLTVKGGDQRRLRIASGQAGDLAIQPTAF